MTDVTIVMTGATAGLGRAAVPLLAGRGVRLVLLARNQHKAADIAADARQAGAAQVDVIECDLSLASSVRQAAAELSGVTVDVIVHDAAVVTPTRTVTAEGSETMLATNYLGPCLLTRLMLAGRPAESPLRLISVGGPLNAKPDLDDLDSEQSFAFMPAFERSKTALNLFTAAVPRHAGNVTAVVYSPGLMKTGLSATVARGMGRIAKSVSGLVLANPAEPAKGLANLVFADLTDTPPGTLFDRHGKPSPIPLQDDVALQDALWQLTSRRLGLDG
ncbi:MAG: SDR family NAD(P)-dependent oxidoreductase [Propionibacteriaceae bacterium]|nr:SDR family NAD(P)-dependent oxidoreductase [Propionibacteriaceae bacterium]